jgi:hypothetical protein
VSHVREELDAAAATPSLSGVWQGLIAQAPTTLDERVYVTLPDFEPLLRFGPCRWMPRLQTATVNVAEGAEAAHTIEVAQAMWPAKGDLCLICFDNQGEPWVAAWWPS